LQPINLPTIGWRRKVDNQYTQIDIIYFSRRNFEFIEMGW
jgi:hypothetical protein